MRLSKFVAVLVLVLGLVAGCANRHRRLASYILMGSGGAVAAVSTGLALGVREAGSATSAGVQDPSLPPRYALVGIGAGVAVGLAGLLLYIFGTK